jgi:beta-N-acetylhexosaminidase
VEEFVVPFAPQDADIREVVSRLQPGDFVIAATLNAYTEPGQAALVRALLASGVPTLVAAMRLPYDLAAFPEAPAFVCTYSILEPSMRALARALFQPAAFVGKLPVAIPGLHPAGFAMQ